MPPFFVFTKEIPEKYKGKYFIGLFLLSFEAGRLNQLDSFARLLHFYCFSRNTHNGHILHHNGHMAIWPFDAIMALWPHSHMAIMAFKMDNMGVFGNGKEIAAIWRRNRVD